MGKLDHNTREGEITYEALLAARLWPQVEMDGHDKCWEWTGTTANEYGSLQLHGEHHYAHRVAYRLTHGEIPEPQINHLCDNPVCVNPIHLYPGTQSDNMMDMYERNQNVRETLEKYGRDAPPEGHKGESHPTSKLTREDVVKIKGRLNSGESTYEIAEDYPVGASSINNIKNGNTWDHV